MKNIILMALLWAFTSAISFGANSNSEKVRHDYMYLIKSLKTEHTLQIFKKEKGGIIQISNNAPIREIRIFNAKGVLVRKETKLGIEHKLDVDRLVSGVYAIRIQIHNEVHTYVYTKE